MAKERLMRTPMATMGVVMCPMLKIITWLLPSKLMLQCVAQANLLLLIRMLLPLTCKKQRSVVQPLWRLMCAMHYTKHLPSSIRRVDMNCLLVEQMNLTQVPWGWMMSRRMSMLNVEGHGDRGYELRWSLVFLCNLMLRDPLIMNIWRERGNVVAV